MSDTTFKGNFTNFDLDPNAYAAFDATGLRDLIIERLTDQNIFTDQIFEGSNISSMIDIVAYSYHVLLFYLNRTANESIFSEAQIYENMNRIVKLINYKPIGYQTSTLTFSAKAKAGIDAGFYTIPRYSFIDIDGTTYSFIKDISFSKTISTAEDIRSIGDENLLYQGKYIEYPIQTATGIDFESFVVSVGNEVNIETNSINVYVRDINSNKIEEYTESESLYLNNPTDRKFEKRYNENGYYEIKMGNGINGRKLNAGDTVYIYYLQSDGESGIIQANSLLNKQCLLYTTPQFIDIKEEIKPQNINYLAFNQIDKIEFANVLPSTNPSENENVADIREFAPKFFRSQQRLITSEDFKNRINRNFGNLLTDVQVLDNETYINTYLSYLDTLGLTNPRLESRVLLNQATFSSSINFNNVYIIGVPRLENKTSANIQSNFLSTAQKNLIKNNVNLNKVIGSEIVFSDPVFTAFDICASSGSEEVSTGLLATSQLVIEPENESTVDKESLKQSVANIIINYFKNEKCKLNQLVDIVSISNEILKLEGVKSFYTTRSDQPTLRVEGLSLLVWNPVYDTADIKITSQNLQMDVFRFPYWFDTTGLISKIII